MWNVVYKIHRMRLPSEIKYEYVHVSIERSYPFLKRVNSLTALHHMSKMFLCQTRAGERSRSVAVLDLNYALLEGFRLKNKPPSHGNCEHASCIARIILGNAARKFLNGRIGFGALGNWKRDAAAAG